VLLLEVRGTMGHGRFVAALLAVNFVIVLQSLIELGAMTAYLWWVPARRVPFDSLG
jgi:hypothetical protein